MGWIKKSFYISIALTVTVLFFDLTILYVFPELGRTLNPVFANFDLQINLPNAFGRGHPRYYYQNHPERGFDIAPGIKAVAQMPVEIPTYPVWGNSLGCFDIEHEPEALQKGYVYLAGDSFTWGFAPFESKFGTLLQKAIKRPVLKCGVTHTGQRHQFQKFLEITKKIGRHPEVVIVNVYRNDICDDLAFPHTVIIDGYQVEDTHVKYDAEGKPQIVRKTLEELTERLRTEIKAGIAKSNRLQNLKTWLKRYSATALIMNGAFEKYIEGGILVNDVGLGHPCGQRSVYPLDENFSENNREVLGKWISHSRRSGYKLYFSPIPSRSTGSGYYSKLEKFLKTNANFIDFQLYIDKNNLDKKSLYWKLDGHFSLRGNFIYAEFLRDSIFKP